MNTHTFEEEFREFFKETGTPTAKYVQEKYIQSKKTTYQSFFASFLLPYGVYAFDTFTSQFNSNHIPFINCKEKNIFNLKAGITELAHTPMPLAESEREIAKFLIQQLSKTPVAMFKNRTKK